MVQTLKRRGILWSTLCLAVLLPCEGAAQGPPHQPPAPHRALTFIGSVPDGVVFFFEDGNDPDTGEPLPPPSVPLAPITETQTIEIETGSLVVPGGTVRDLLQIDIYLRQRYFYRNDGQDRFEVLSNPIVEIESPVLDGVLRFAVLGNGLHLAAAKSLVPGEAGHDSRGNFGRAILTREGLDARFGPGVGRRVFAGDLTVRMLVSNRVLGLQHFVVGTFTQLYGQ